MKLCIGNLKGGVGKTTTAVHLALGLARTGRTLLVDADPDQAGSAVWADMAEDWPEHCTVVDCASLELAKRIRPMVTDYEHLVLDVGPKNPGLLKQAMTLADHLVIPIAPTSHDVPEATATYEIAAEMDAISPVTAAVLLVKVDLRWSHSEPEARELLAKEELPTMTHRVRHLLRYANSRGSVPGELGDYEDVLAELHDEEGQT